MRALNAHDFLKPSIVFVWKNNDVLYGLRDWVNYSVINSDELYACMLLFHTKLSELHFKIIFRFIDKCVAMNSLYSQ